MFAKASFLSGVCALLLLLGEESPAVAQVPPEREDPDLIRQVISINGTFDAGEFGWIFSGGGEVVITGEPDDDPFALLPDGGLVFLYQKVSSPAPFFEVSFDFFTDLITADFPSPGGFPDTVFGTIYFGPSEEELRPELLQAGASISLFDYDAVNGLRGVLESAALTESLLRPGWMRFDGKFSAIAEQSHLALTFQALNGNGLPGDSLFLVDNVLLVAVPEPSTIQLGLLGGLILLSIHFRNRRSTLHKNAAGQ
jgi:hypothetical protein